MEHGARRRENGERRGLRIFPAGRVWIARGEVGRVACEAAARTVGGERALRRSSSGRMAEDVAARRDRRTRNLLVRREVAHASACRLDTLVEANLGRAVATGN